MDRELLAHVAITRLQGRYADIASRQAWSEVQSIVLPDATFSFDLGAGDVLTFVGPDELAAFGARACERFTFYQYIPLNTVVSLTSKHRASGRSYALEVGVDKANGEWTEFYGLYDDDYAVDHGEWRFARRHFHTLARRGGGKTRTFPPTSPG
jgi:SnoaL-like domain